MYRNSVEIARVFSRFLLNLCDFQGSFHLKKSLLFIEWNFSLEVHELLLSEIPKHMDNKDLRFLDDLNVYSIM